MAVLLNVKYDETCKVLEALGYDPARIQMDSAMPAAYTWVGDHGEEVRKPWGSPTHWDIVRGAMERDWHRASALVDGADPVNHPKHYTSDPSGVECITITRHRTFNVGNAIKYLWRAGLKSDAGRDPVEKQIEDLRKAVWYLNDEIALLGGKA